MLSKQNVFVTLAPWTSRDEAYIAESQNGVNNNNSSPPSSAFGDWQCPAAGILHADSCQESQEVSGIVTSFIYFVLRVV